MKKIGKGVLTVSIALFATAVLSGCVSGVNPETGEKTWEFAPGAAVKGAIETVKELPDETKASILDGVGWLLGTLGVGVAATPVCSGLANYYRNRKKKAVATATVEVSAASGEQKKSGETV